MSLDALERPSLQRFGRLYGGQGLSKGGCRDLGYSLRNVSGLELSIAICANLGRGTV